MLHYFYGKLMLLGFVSLLLSVCQSRIVKICVYEDTTKHFLPCSLDAKANRHTLRELLENKHSSTGYCALKVITLAAKNLFYSKEQRS
ncbi:hypothetical protein HanHA300_Chr00c0015g0682571 [Helianthus annuus]|nr:hypothetical protein HanHA300_Chr00c0015g0682571 [Helianthus annuus]